MADLTDALDALERDLLALREEIANALILEAVQNREVDKLRAERDLLTTRREELEADSAQMRDFQERCALLLQQEVSHRAKHTKLMARLGTLRASLQAALTRLDSLVAQHPQPQPNTPQR